MPCFFVMNGKKQEMDEDIFEEMLQELHQSTATIPQHCNTKPSRFNPNGTYNSKPLDPKYFNNYYHEKLSTPFKCPDCGKMLSSKSNYSKHRNRNICMKNRRQG